LYERFNNYYLIKPTKAIAESKVKVDSLTLANLLSGVKRATYHQMMQLRQIVRGSLPESGK